MVVSMGVVTAVFVQLLDSTAREVRHSYYLCKRMALLYECEHLLIFCMELEHDLNLAPSVTLFPRDLYCIYTAA